MTPYYAIAAIASAEDRVGRLQPQVDLRVSSGEIEALLLSGEYLESVGLYAGRHFRKERGKGCYHLRVTNGQGFLHWDRWDPRRFPLQHLLETPELLVSTGILALVAFGLRK